MKRPEKKEINKNKYSTDQLRYPFGYNQACDDYEKFLPSEEEIIEVIANHYELFKPYPKHTLLEFKKIAKAISKRIRGEK